MTALSGPAASTTSTRADQPASPVPIPTAPPDLVSSRPFSRIPQDLPEMPAPQPLSRRSASLTWREQLRATSPALAHAPEALLKRLSPRPALYKWTRTVEL